MNWTDSVKLLLVFMPVVSPEMVREGEVVATFWAKVRPTEKTHTIARNFATINQGLNLDYPFTSDQSAPFYSTNFRPVF